MYLWVKFKRRLRMNAFYLHIFLERLLKSNRYYQPNPNATLPFPPVAAINDPNFAVSCVGVAGNCADGWGLRVINSKNVLVYGAGLYSFFNNYNTCKLSSFFPERHLPLGWARCFFLFKNTNIPLACSAAGNGEVCQSRIFDLEGPALSNVKVYNLNTIGATSMIDRNGQSLARFADNVNVFPDTIALFRSG